MKLTDTRDRIEAVDAGLPGSLFRDVDLSTSEFSDVNLTGSRFENVNLSNVDISDANLTGMRIHGILVSDLLAAYGAER